MIQLADRGRHAYAFCAVFLRADATPPATLYAAEPHAMLLRAMARHDMLFMLPARYYSPLDFHA